MEQMGIQQGIQENLVNPNIPILLFDGVCNLCHHAVQFVIRHEKKPTIHFASLQSELGQSYIEKTHLPKEGLKSLIFVENGKIYTHSTAALKMGRYLKAPWSWAYIFIILPKSFRDFFYNYIAKNRYKWFGKKEECMLPSPEVKARFLD